MIEKWVNWTLCGIAAILFIVVAVFGEKAERFGDNSFIPGVGCVVFDEAPPTMAWCRGVWEQRGYKDSESYVHLMNQNDWAPRPGQKMVE